MAGDMFAAGHSSVQRQFPFIAAPLAVGKTIGIGFHRNVLISLREMNSLIDSPIFTAAEADHRRGR
jgi:hypothetical protein